MAAQAECRQSRSRVDNDDHVTRVWDCHDGETGGTVVGPGDPQLGNRASGRTCLVTSKRNHAAFAGIQVQVQLTQCGLAVVVTVHVTVTEAVETAWHQRAGWAAHLDMSTNAARRA